MKVIKNIKKILTSIFISPEMHLIFLILELFIVYNQFNTIVSSNLFLLQILLVVQQRFCKSLLGKSEVSLF